MKRMKTVYCGQLLALGMALAIEPVLNAAEIYVSADGSDSNPGTAERPFATIGKGAASAQAGDTVWIKPGTYQPAEMIRPAKSGTPDAPIAYRAQAGGEVIIDGQGKVPSRSAEGVIAMAKKSWIVLDGLRVINSRWCGVFASASTNITVQNCSAKNTYASGIYIRTSTGVKVLGNSVQRACQHPAGKPLKDTQECISLVGCSGFEIAYNEVFDRMEDTNNGGEGIDTKEACRSGKVHHNHVHDLVRLGIYCDAYASQLENVEIFANTVHDCRAGIAVACEQGGIARGIKIHDNLVRDCARVGLRLAGYVQGGPIQDVANDFRLASGSPAIAAALGEPLSTSDHDDRVRPIAGHGDSKALADLGAFERQASAQSGGSLSVRAAPEKQ